MSSIATPSTADEQPPLVRRAKPRRFVITPNADRVEAIHAVIAGVASDPAIHAALAAHGYSRDRIAEGQRLYAAVHELSALLRQQQHRRHTALDAYEAATASAQIAFSQMQKLARVAFKHEPLVMMALELDGTRRRGAGVWRRQARALYSAMLAHPSLAMHLATFGVSQQHLLDGQQMLAVVNTTIDIARRDARIADDTMRRRNLAFADLDIWYAEFVATARSALATQPELLAQLVIPPR